MARDTSLVRVIDRRKPNGAREYGVRYADGHVEWFPSFPAAMFAWAKATSKKR